MSDNLDAEIATLRADVTALKDEVAVANTTLGSFSDQLTAALEAAKNQGATPAQLASLTALDTELKEATASLTTGVTSHPLPTDPAPEPTPTP